METRPTVRLDVFDGPLDLLLYLVHNQELDPKTINVAAIADQYIAFLENMKELQLGVAGDFLVMAAKLLALKARELLPREERGALEPEEFDFDRDELVRQLLEYRRFKEAARHMQKLEGKHFGGVPRGMADKQAAERTSDELAEGEIGIFDLLKAFRKVLSDRPKQGVHEIEIDDVPLEERMNQMRSRISREGRVMFEELVFHDSRRMVIVVTFMSLLELVKTEELAARQSRNGTIFLYKRGSEEFAAEMALASDGGYGAEPDVNPDVAPLLENQERKRQEWLAREEAEWTDEDAGISAGLESERAAADEVAALRAAAQAEHDAAAGAEAVAAGESAAPATETEIADGPDALAGPPPAETAPVAASGGSPDDDAVLAAVAAAAIGITGEMESAAQDSASDVAASAIDPVRPMPSSGTPVDPALEPGDGPDQVSRPAAPHSAEIAIDTLPPAGEESAA